MYSPPNKPSQPCPVCGAEPSYRVWSITLGSGYGHVIIHSKKHKFNGSKATPLVCTVCGYVQLFVNPEDFR